MRFSLFILSLSAALLVAALFVGRTADTASAQQGTATVTMSAATGPDGGGSQTGTVALTANGSQTEVVINIAASPDGATVEQPGHIHSGTCDNLPSSLLDVVYPLTNVVNGASTTTVDATLESLHKGVFAVNIHKSGDELGVYVSCGNIPPAAGMVPTTGGPPPASSDSVSAQTYLLIAAGALALLGGGALALRFRRR